MRSSPRVNTCKPFPNRLVPGGSCPNGETDLDEGRGALALGPSPAIGDTGLLSLLAVTFIEQGKGTMAQQRILFHEPASGKKS